MEIDLLSMVKDVGIPGGISIYLLMIGTKVIREMTSAMNNQTAAFQELTIYLRGLKKDE